MKIITISGASGSGKSTIADFIHNSAPGSLLLSLDRYYLSPAEQIQKNGHCNFDHPAAIDIELLKEHLNALKEDSTANVPIYDFTVSKRAGFEQVKASQLIIIDGLLAGSLLANESDLNIFVDVDLDLALLRRIERDIRERGRTLESVKEQYLKFVRPAYFEYVAALKPKADIIITNNGSTSQLIDEAAQLMKQLELDNI